MPSTPSPADPKTRAFHDAVHAATVAAVTPDGVNPLDAAVTLLAMAMHIAQTFKTPMPRIAEHLDMVWVQMIGKVRS